MMTVAEFARQEGCTPKTIYQRLNRVKPFYPEGLTEKKGGKLYITAVGASALTIWVKEGNTGVKPFNPILTEGLNPVKPLESDEVEEIAHLRAQNKLLMEELGREREHSRTQADRLADLADQLAELTRNQQVLLGAEQTRTNPALLPIDAKRIEAEPKKGFLARLFHRK